MTDSCKHVVQSPYGIAISGKDDAHFDPCPWCKISALESKLGAAELVIADGMKCANEQLERANDLASRLSSLDYQFKLYKSFMREVDKQAAEAHMASVVEREESSDG